MRRNFYPYLLKRVYGGLGQIQGAAAKKIKMVRPHALQ